MSLQRRLLGIFGGTFDPFHHGHLVMAQRLLEQLPLEQIIFVPNRLPPHRAPPYHDAEQRVQLIAKAIQNEPNMTVSRCELDRPGTSYMWDTLQTLRSTWPNHILCLIMGEDAFYQFNRWHQWRNILAISHLIVLDRPLSLPAKPPDWATELLQQRGTTDVNALLSHAQGQIFQFHTPPIDVSSTQLRQQLGKKD